MTQDIAELLKDLNLDMGKLQELAAAAQKNPFAAMAKVHELGISFDQIQKVMKAVMANPEGFFDMAKSMGVSDEMLASARERLGAKA